MAIASPFAAQETRAGAVEAERFGVLLPEHFGAPDQEYEAVRQSVGLLNMSFRGLIRLTGADRLRWLNGQITNDLKNVLPGQGQLAAILNVKGHILSDLAVYGLEDSVWVDLNRDRAQGVRDTFDRYIVADDVVAENASERFARLMLAGPRSRPVMAGALGASVADLAAWHHAEARLGDVQARIIAIRWLGMPGYEVIAPADAAGKLWEVLTSPGKGFGVRAVGMAALDCLRIEAGWPWFGADFDDSNLLMESLSTDHVSFTKGCYIGQEVVIRVEHQGHLNKKLSGLRISGEAVPAVKADILSGDRKVGTVTSATFSPALHRAIALGYVRRGFWDPGTKLRVTSGDQSLEAEIAPLPFIEAEG